jgi:hypothetical protein
MVCYVHQASRLIDPALSDQLSIGHCAVGIGTQMKPLSSSRISGSVQGEHLSGIDVAARCEQQMRKKSPRFYKPASAAILNRRCVILIPSPACVSLFSAYAQASSWIEFWFRVHK